MIVSCSMAGLPHHSHTLPTGAKSTETGRRNSLSNMSFLLFRAGYRESISIQKLSFHSAGMSVHREHHNALTEVEEYSLNEITDILMERKSFTSGAGMVSNRARVIPRRRTRNCLYKAFIL